MDRPSRLSIGLGKIPRVIVITWLVLQIGIPTAALVRRGLGPDPQPFAWQMFTSTGKQAQIFVETTDSGGELRESTSLLYRSRAEFPGMTEIAEQLCMRDSHIRVVARRGLEETTTLC